MSSQMSQASFIEPSYKRAKVDTSASIIRRKRYYKRAIKRVVVPPAVRTYVRSAIARSLEHKSTDNYQGNTAVTPWIVSTGGTGIAIPLLPLLSQGAGAGQRIGNNIKIVKNWLKLNLSTKSSNVYPTSVIVYIVSSKLVGAQGSNLGTSEYSNFFKVGNTAATLQANLLDATFEIDSDVLTSHHKGIYPLAPYDVTTAGKSVCDSISRTLWDLTFDLTSYYHGTVKYDDNDSAFPTNKNMYCILQPVFSNGTDTVANTQMAYASWNNHCIYTDA